jgi:predicted RNA-binding protein YlxR (DUF448 family)
VRFEAVDGVLRPSLVPAGRGAYTCRAAGCFERAAARGAFTRSLRRAVAVGPELGRLYTEVSHG